MSTLVVKAFACLLLASVHVSIAAAQESPQSDGHTIQLATLFEKNEKPEWGDFIRVERPFGSWSLKCELRPSLNKRLCSTEQRVYQGQQAAFVWRVAMDKAFKPIAVFSMPPELVKEGGLRLSFAGLQKHLAESDFNCDPIRCLGSFPLEQPILTAIMGADTIDFTYALRRSGKVEIVRADSPVQGMALALEAAGKDPFAKQLAQAAPPPAPKSNKKPKKK